MKPYINGVLVVEGKSDAALITSLFDVSIYVTNGFDLTNDFINFLNEVINKKPVIVLTDFDEAGELIRKRILQKVPNAIDLKFVKTSKPKHGKNGVAESSCEEIKSALAPYISTREDKPILTTKDLTDLELTGSEKSRKLRTFIAKGLHLSAISTKTFLNQLNDLEIKKEQLQLECDKYVD